ncbi:homeobox protein 3 [Condylostylus longicornis]|uniref:homeobox protein 3 n=1 Tax=Condylostylus longicornis TaxID=2530218 RepID=UPI00244E4C25|nr:homeobox protein 3 [Condylostylus longicornis]
MDILDIDEIEDDFGIFEEKIQDDVTNILRQWKIGSNKKDAFDSRTFTRPKGSVIRNSIDGSQIKSPHIQENQSGMCMKIGGLVSNIQKSFLNDVSPPNSICSSMNLESETMANSLITSADFSNISFFKTSLIDSNIDFAFKNNLKQYNNIENECRFKLEKNIPNDFYNDTTMKSSVSKDNQKNYKSEKTDIEENINLLTDSTKENSPNCPEIDNSGSSFQNNTQIMSNTFKKRNSTIYDNSVNILKESEPDERSADINKTFLRKSKAELQFNSTFEVDINIPVKNTSTPQKAIVNEIDNNVDFSPITPFIKNEKLKKEINEEELSPNENIFDIPLEIQKEIEQSPRNNSNQRPVENSFENDNLDIDEFTDLSDKVDNFREDAMKKSLESIKKRYSHKFDKVVSVSEKPMQKFGNPFPENGRLLSRRSRLNDDLTLYQNIKNESENNNQIIENEKKSKNDLTFVKSNVSENIAEDIGGKNQIVNESNDEKDVDTKKKNETKRCRNEDRFKTIKINKPLIDQYKGEILESNETEHYNPTAFGKIDKNSKISSFENEPLKFEDKYNPKIRDPQGQATIKNLKYERISKIENLGKAISASNLESTAKSEQNANFKFAVPAPVKQIKSPMGTKAKSFHNLASNNFGFGVRKQSLQIQPKTQENNFSSTFQATNVKNNPSKNNESCLKATPMLRPINIQKKSGLLRPSSGYFSKGVSTELNALQTTFIKDSEKIVKIDSNCSNINNFNSDPATNEEINATVKTKSSKLVKPTESKLVTNIKRSGLPRPSLHYRKQL